MGMAAIWGAAPRGKTLEWKGGLDRGRGEGDRRSDRRPVIARWG